MSALPVELRLAFGFFVILVAIAAIGWVFWRSFKGSPDPGGLLFRWGVTAFLLIGGGFLIHWLVGDGDAGGQIMAVLGGAVLGLALAVVWVPSIVGRVGDMFGGLYTGGRTPPTPTPAYSIAEARRKQGRHQEAIAEIEKQLEQFPTDVTGQMMRAEVFAEDLRDYAAAEAAIERFLAQEHAPRNVAYALNTLADWRLKLLNDIDGAREALERIGTLLPNTVESQNAAQRIAHLITPEELLRRQEAGPIAMPQGRRDLGLRDEPRLVCKTDEEPDMALGRLCGHLAEHPLDREAREELAALYADQFQQLDAAIEQFEQLAQIPNQTPRDVARWLHRVADLQVRQGADLETIRLTLQRIIDRFPGLAPAELAQQRIGKLRLELKGKESSQSVHLGEYEKDLGLKMRGPQPPQDQ